MPSTRRRFLAGAGLGVLGAAGGAALAADDDSASPSPLDWPMARYDRAGTGHNPDATGPTDDVALAWEHDATDWFLGTSQPIRLDDTLYAAGAGLLALDVETGERRFGVPGAYTTTPARAPTSIYTTDTLATTDPAGVAGVNAGGGLRVPVLGSIGGGERWRGPASPGPGFFGGVDQTPPVAADGTVYGAVPGTNTLAAIDPTDGEVLWEFTHHEDEGVSGMFNRPVIVADRVVATALPYVVTARDVETGDEYWHRELDEQQVMPPVATGEGIVVQTRNAVRLLDAADGQRLWHRSLDTNVVESVPAVADGTIYAPGEHERLYALDLASGETEWSRPFAGPTTPVPAGEMVYTVRRGYALVGMDAASGETRFTYEPPEMPLSPPIVGDGLLYAANRERVIALREAR